MINNLIKNHNAELDIYTISEQSKIEQKILRSLLNHNNLKCALRSKTRSRDTYKNPSEELLFSNLSILSHQIYLCEGWHTNNTNTLFFVNQDIQLIKTFCQCLITTYQYTTTIAVYLVYNYSDTQSITKVQNLANHFQDNKKYIVYFTNDPTRKNPIIRVKTGGKNLASLFIENAYKILHDK